MSGSFKRSVWFFLFLFSASVPVFAGDLTGSLYLDNFQFTPETPTSDSVISPADLAPASYSVQIQGDQPNRLTLKAFPSNLGHNAVSLFSTQNLLPFLSGMAVSGVATHFDDTVEDYFVGKNTHTAFSEAGTTFGEAYVLVPAIGTLFVTGLHSDNSHFKAFSYALTQGYVLDFGVTMGLKTVTQRQRPDGSNSMSFPSGHSTDSFMIATVVDQFYGHKAGILAYAVAGLVSASRLKSNVHWLSDVTAGATIGYIVGKTVSRNMGGLMITKHVQVVPSVNPFEKQYGVAFNIHLP